MSVLLFVVGAIAVMAGAVMVAFGIPINEFSFGNTLIGAGATTVMGGLIVLGLGVVVAQLQRVVEALATRPPMRASRAMEPFAQGAGIPSAAARIPFPPRPKTESRAPRPAEPQLDLPKEIVPEAPHDEGLTAAPTLRNPDEPAVTVDESDELPLSPRAPHGTNGSGGLDKRHEPVDTAWRAPSPPPVRQPQTAFFDNMWPAPEPRAAKAPASEAKNEAKLEPKYEPKYETKSDYKSDYKSGFKPEAKLDSTFEPKVEAESKFEPRFESKFEPALEPKPEPEFEAQAEPEAELTPDPRTQPEPRGPMPHDEAQAEQAQPGGEVRAVAILKSGVVDGMGYTLYVDGSIEAELPQGTLRFASIEELRSHLEKTS